MSAPTYVIVAAGSALGTALARRLSATGAQLVLTARDLSTIDALTTDVAGRAVQVDATRFDDVDRAVAEATGWTGRLDGIVNCAGSIVLKPAHLTSEADFTAVLDTNLRTAFAVVRAGAAAMRQSGGAIVLVSSAAAEIGLPNHEAIAAAKAGVLGLMRSAAATYATSGIRVNAVAPGLVASPLSRAITSNEMALKASIAMHPLGRIGTPDDIAAAVAWLLGPESTWVTGQVLGVDGGLAHVKGRQKQ